jgi:hypothetical protein
MVFRVRPAIGKHRVVWADLARHLVATALTARNDSQYIPLNSCYVAVAKSAHEAERLAAWLNSTWMRAAARLGAMPASGGFARFNARTIERLPLPTSVAGDAGLSSLATRWRAGSAAQDELDEIAAKHLDLTSTSRNALRSVLDGTSRDRR